VLVHVVAPLSVPAAVGLAGLVRYGRRAVERDSAGRVVAAVLVLVAVSGQAGAVAASDVFAPSAPENRLAQYGQPADDLDDFATDVRNHTTPGDGVDVLYYGERFYVADETSLDQPPVPDQFGERLPLAWYVERAGATTDSALSLDHYTDDELPPVVVADVSHRSVLSDRLTDYEKSEYELALWNRDVVVFVRSS
jgi:predicted membrane-bound mannosyltransferase